MGSECSVGPVIRWDYYKELGYPEIKNQEGMLKVLADMVAKHPKTEDGKNVYGVSFWSDWGTWPYFYTTAPYLGYRDIGAIGAIKIDTNELVNGATDFNAPYWSSVNYFYQANKLGIFDKDSLIQKYGDYGAKCTSGQILSGQATWAMGDFNSKNAKDGKGLMVVPMDWGYTWGGVYSVTGWGDKNLAITKSCKTPDRAMEFLNYLYSMDGVRTITSGVKGSQWDVVDGTPKLNDATIKARSENGDAAIAIGMTQVRGGWDENLQGLSGFTVNTADNLPLSLFNTADAYASALNPLQKDFCEYYGIKYPYEIFKNKLDAGKIADQRNLNTAALSTVTSPPDDIKRYEAKVNEVMLKEFAKCVLSKSDAEFEANRKNAVEALKAAGVDTYFNWYKTEFDKAVAANK